MGAKWSNSCSLIVKVKCYPRAKLREGYRRKIQAIRGKTGRARGFRRLEWTTDKPSRYSEKKNNISPLWPSRIAVLGRQPLFSKHSLFLGSPWRRIKPSAREPRVCDPRDLERSFPFVPGVVTDAAGSLADSGSRTHCHPSRMTSLWGSFPGSLNSGSWNSLLVCGLPFFSSWRRHCQEVQGNMLWKGAAFYPPRPAWSQKKQCSFHGFTLGQCGPEGSSGVGSSVAKDRGSCLKSIYGVVSHHQFSLSIF